MKPFKFKTDLTIKDYKSLCKLQAKGSLIVAALAGGAFIAIMLMRFLGDSVPLLVLTGIAGCIAVYFAVWGYISWRATRIYSMSSVSDELELTLDDKGITQISQSGETELEWDDVYKVVEIRGCYFVFLTRNKAFYFPKRNFDSYEHEKEFVSWIAEKVHPGRINFKK